MQSAAVGRRVQVTAVWVVAALSGAAGLGYEMVWARLLGVALGTEMLAVLGSIAGLFTGLALGGWLLDDRVRRAMHPNRLYAALEGVIALWGVVCMALLPMLARGLPPLLGPSPSALVIWSVSLLLPAIVLLPATVAMGGTLAALERWIVSVSGSDRQVAGAYAANTFGAVAGTVLSVGWSFGALGLAGTLGALAALNVLAALMAWVKGGAPAAARPVAAAAADARNGYRLFTLFVTGLFGIAVEVLVVRIAAQFLSDTIYSFAALLAAYLLGSALGAALRQRLTLVATASTRAVLLSINALTVLATVGVLPAIARWAQVNAVTDRTGEFLIAAAIFLPLSVAMGALFGDLMEEYAARNGSVGRASAVNAAGAALAPALAALVLIPGLGAMRSLTAIGMGYPLLGSYRGRRWIVGIVPLAVGLGLWIQPAPLPVGLPPGGRQVASIEGPMVAASVVDDANGARYLEVNGHFRMGGTHSERSDFRQAWLPLLLHPDPRRALYLGVGTGATLSGAQLYPGLDVRGVEIAEEAVALLPYFAVPGRPDPAPAVVVADARRYVAAQTDRYDVIVADNFHPALEGSGSLYAVEHFRAVRRRLSAGGVFCQWLPLYQLDEQSLKDVARSFGTAFADASVWLAHYSIRMPMMALCGTADGQGIALTGLASRLSAPGLSARVRELEFATPLAVAGAYLGGAAELADYAGSGPLNSDDRPVVALNGHRNVQALAVPPETLLLRVVSRLHRQSATLRVDGVAPERLAAYWRARDRFLAAGAALKGDPRGRALIDAAAPGLLAAVRESDDFDPAYQPLLAMADALQSMDPAAARSLLDALDQAAPSRPDARQRLKDLAH
jgi:spermidine synthase